MRFIVALISGKIKLAIFVIFELQFVERCVMVIDSKYKTLLIGKKGDICSISYRSKCFNQSWFDSMKKVN